MNAIQNGVADLERFIGGSLRAAAILWLLPIGEATSGCRL